MKMAVSSSKSYDRTYLGEANAGRHEVTFLDAHLDLDAAALAQGFEAVCVFVNDSVSRPVLER